MSNTSVIADQTDNYGAPAADVLGAVMLVNVFTPKEGKAEAFVEAQTAEYRRLRGQIHRGSGDRTGNTSSRTNNSPVQRRHEAEQDLQSALIRGPDLWIADAIKPAVRKARGTLA